MSASVLTHLVDNGVLTITLNRPEVLNSLDESLTLGLVDAMHEAKTDSAVRAVVITGAGRAFCAGADLNARSWPAVKGVSAARPPQRIWSEALIPWSKPSLNPQNPS